MAEIISLDIYVKSIIKSTYFPYSTLFLMLSLIINCFDSLFYQSHASMIAGLLIVRALDEITNCVC